MRYTIEQQGRRWIASNGTHNVEADEADDALYLLLRGEIAEDADGDAEDEISEARVEDIEARIGNRVVTLIRLVAIKAPAAFLRNEVEMLRGLIDKFIAEQKE